MTKVINKQRAPSNRTITLNDVDILRFQKRLIKLDKPALFEEIENKTIHQDIFEALDYLTDKFVDLVFVDPPYNLNKTFNLTSFKAMESKKYEEWLDSWVQKMNCIVAWRKGVWKTPSMIKQYKVILTVFFGNGIH